MRRMRIEIDWLVIESLWIHTSVNLVSCTSGGAVVNRCYIDTKLTRLVMKRSLYRTFSVR